MKDIINKGKKYSIIYADPPWQYRTYSKKGNIRSAELHYNTLSLEEICNFPVKDICEKDAVLFLWTTQTHLEQSFKVIKAWGFEYKTMGFTWVKKNRKSDSFFIGLGYYTRANPEYCLLATRGKTLKRQDKSIRNLVIAKVREHSRKPDEVRKRIERLFDKNLKKIELFARNKTPGWDVWGNEVDKF